MASTSQEKVRNCVHASFCSTILDIIREFECAYIRQILVYTRQTIHNSEQAGIVFELFFFLSYSTNTANGVLSTIVSIQPKDTGGGSGETRESVVYRLADDMLSKLPEDYVPHLVKDRLKKMGHLQPLNIFLRQEIDRMQRVITTVRNTLQDLKLAIDGTIIMSENLRDALDNMFDARIPNTWKKVRCNLALFFHSTLS